MTLVEVLLFATGMSMEIFAWVVCKSSEYSKIDRRKIGLFSLAFAIWETIALLAGYYGVYLLKKSGLSDNAANTLRLFAIIFLIIFALDFLYRGIKNEPVDEKRSDEVSFGSLMRSLSKISLHTLLESISFSFCDTRFIYVIVIPMSVSIIVTLIALGAGYHYGFEVKSKAYIIGFIVIMCAVVEMAVRLVI